MKTAEHIIETVDKLVRKYHTRDPYELCQLLGIKIHYYDLQKKLKGFFYYQSRQKNIVIDHNVQRILVAHESRQNQSRHQSTFLRLSMLLHYTFFSFAAISLSMMLSHFAYGVSSKK